MQSMVKGQAPLTLERTIAAGEKQKEKLKIVHTITETNRVPQTKIQK